ncbi:hypothetical protein BVG00_22610 [Bacillus cereus]|uniref:nucleotidyltransferase domain-containing protein n=1 Tax=Bacillus cereus TaxID=1396 RepID=UPI00099C4AF6|nr:nucleotidyltransferase domain-containing protein [Bacillus cereus]NSL61107.1 nucleotidyltransferase domain-containing protein [Bacillus cereus]OPD42616.1 hypothetical protein BVG00_22610 [Bacillus cereus]
MNITDEIQSRFKLFYNQANTSIPLSIYLIGSVASGEFNPKSSDLDYIFVLKRNSDDVKAFEELRRIRNLSYTFRDKINNIISEYVDVKNPFQVQNEFFYEDEFCSYLQTFAVRVWNPLYSGVWKHIVGENYLPNNKPSEYLIKHDLVVSFRTFTDEFYQCNHDPIRASKYLRRALTKAIWLLQGYRPARKDVLVKCSEYTNHSSIPFLIDETKRISDQGFRYEKDNNFKRYCVEGAKLLTYFESQIIQKQEVDRNKIEEIKLHQDFYLRLREGRFHFFGAADPLYLKQVPIYKQLSRNLYDDFLEDMNIIRKLQAFYEVEFEEYTQRYINNHLNWLENPCKDILEYYEKEFFSLREKMFQDIQKFLIDKNAIVCVKGEEG